MIVTLLTEHHLEFLSIKGGCTGSSESTHVKLPHCWESHVVAQQVTELKMIRMKTGSLCQWFTYFKTELNNFHVNNAVFQASLISAVLPAMSDGDLMFCLQSYKGLIIDRSLVY